MGRRRCSGRLLLIINTSVRKSFKVKMKLIYLKDIDKSILYQGFTIRTALLNQFIDFFGKLAIGETRRISIMWDNQLFTDIDVINQNFNRVRYPNHPEMYQVRYSPNHPFAKALRLAFPELTQYLEQQLALKKELTQQGVKTHNIRIPNELRSSIVFYATANKDIWEAVSIPAHEINQAKQELAVVIRQKLFNIESPIEDCHRTQYKVSCSQYDIPIKFVGLLSTVRPSLCL